MQEDTAIKWLWLSGLVIVLDQITKALAVRGLELYESVAILPSFNLTLMHNTGAAFSLLGQAGGWQRWFFVAIAMVMSVVLAIWMRRTPGQRRWLGIGLALVLGGAIGNLWDRLELGYVIDFIDVYYAHWHWPAFNIADSAISVGVVVLLFDAFKQDQEEQAPC